MVLPSFVNTELTAGTKGLPGLKNAEPEDIAQAIVALIERPRPQVRVSRLVGTIAASQKFLPRRFAESLNRAMGADHVFLEQVDAAARKAYEDRARHS